MRGKVAVGSVRVAARISAVLGTDHAFTASTKSNSPIASESTIATHHTFRCKDALEFPSTIISQLQSCGQAIHRLNDAVVRDPDLMQSALSPYTGACSFMRMDVERHVARIKFARPKPRLYLPFAVYIMDAETGTPILINTNTAGGEPVGMEHVVRLARHQRNDIADGPMSAMAEALSVTSRLVHPEKPCVAFYTQHWDALGTPVDSVSTLALAEMAAYLQESCELEVVYLTARDILDQTILDDNGDLCFGGHRISAIFSPSITTGDDLNGHPTGKFMSAVDMLDEAFRAQCEVEWDALDKIAASSAVMAHCWLGGKTRPLWHYLLKHEALSSLISNSEAKQIMAVTPQYLSLSTTLFPVEAHAAEAMVDEASDTKQVVAVNILRPRLTTTSEGRIAPTILASADLAHAVFDSNTRDYYAITRKVPQPVHTVQIELGGEQSVSLPCHTELAIYSQYLVDADGAVLIDSAHGLGVRSAPVDKASLLGVALGYGALGAAVVSDGLGYWWHGMCLKSDGELVSMPTNRFKPLQFYRAASLN